MPPISLREEKEEPMRAQQTLAKQTSIRLGLAVQMTAPAATICRIAARDMFLTPSPANVSAFHAIARRMSIGTTILALANALITKNAMQSMEMQPFGTKLTADAGVFLNQTPAMLTRVGLLTTASVLAQRSARLRLRT